ncbi:MAG: heme exporter protein CcmB [Gammaproteobacteria bacterium]|nr:heme exporter protein CcmB [Gammaproteobacteria bacterium]MCY4255465.1 heme exporter protein CcmB [Gammaproteobacteria bacterium]MCY4340218.1 heme exporter protein CcmB [Gammaproteobacteria bacterium]
MRIGLAVLRNEFLIYFKKWVHIIINIAFFIFSTSLFSLVAGLEQGLLAEWGAGVIWVVALLSMLLAMPLLFQPDREDGTLDLMLLSAMDPAWLALAKAGANWCVFGLPLVLLSPLLGASYGLEGIALVVLPATLALGTPALILLATVAAALTAGLRRGVGLLALLVLPLALPILLFGVRATELAADGFPTAAPLMMLGAFLLLALGLLPWAAGAALRATAN